MAGSLDGHRNVLLPTELGSKVVQLLCWSCYEDEHGIEYYVAAYRAPDGKAYGLSLDPTAGSKTVDFYASSFADVSDLMNSNPYDLPDSSSEAEQRS